MFSRNVNTTFEKNSGIPHPEHEVRNTRVSEYLRKYGQGKIDSLPTDNRPMVNDTRSTDEKLDHPDVTDRFGADPLDVMMELDRKKEDFEKAFEEIELTSKQKERFDAAKKVLENPNSSYEQKSDAHRILEELQESKKVTRTRD